MQAHGLKCSGSWACAPIEGSLSIYISLWIALLTWVLWWCCQRRFGSQSALVVEHTSSYRTSVCCNFPPFGNWWGTCDCHCGNNNSRALCGNVLVRLVGGTPRRFAWPSLATCVTC